LYTHTELLRHNVIIKVKLSLSLFRYQAMKTYGTLPFYPPPRKMASGTQGGWLDPGLGLDLMDVMPLLGIEPGFLGRLACSLLIEWAILVPYNVIILQVINDINTPINWSLDSSVSIVTVYGLDSRGSVPRRGNRSFSSPQHPDQICANQAFHSVGTGAHSPGLKRRLRGADHSPPSSAEVKNGGVIIPLHRMSSWCGA
jgi:hypothetical protein